MHSVISLLLSAMASCQGNSGEKKFVTEFPKDTANFTTITWVDSLKDIGAIIPGTKTEITFRFKNTGVKPLLIVSAEPGCGCTVANYPKEAILPGAEGSITAAYNADANATGEFRKNIHVVTNSAGSQDHYIYFYGSIKEPGSSKTSRKLDTLQLTKRITRELKRNLLLKPTKI